MLFFLLSRRLLPTILLDLNALLHELVNNFFRLVGLTQDGKRPMVVFTDWHDNVLDFAAEEVHILRPASDLVELNVVLHALSMHLLVHAHLVAEALHVRRYHLHEETVEDVDGV